jgi:hypothetical protein
MDDTLKTYLSPLDNTSNREAVARFLDLSLEFLLDPSHVDYQSQLGELAGEFR